jgi:hypothetical protein
MRALSSLACVVPTAFGPQILHKFQRSLAVNHKPAATVPGFCPQLHAPLIPRSLRTAVVLREEIFSALFRQHLVHWEVLYRRRGGVLRDVTCALICETTACIGTPMVWQMEGVDFSRLVG